jgi:hypothetical protein
LKAAPTLTRPIGLFPEGVAGVAGQLTQPLPGVDRLIAHLGKIGLPALPCAISETDRLIVRFGPLVPAAELVRSPQSAELVMGRVGDLLAGRL